MCTMQELPLTPSPAQVTDFSADVSLRLEWEQYCWFFLEKVTFKILELSSGKMLKPSCLRYKPTQHNLPCFLRARCAFKVD